MPESSCEGQRRFLNSIRLVSDSQMVQGLLFRRDCSAENVRTWCLWNLTAVSRTLPSNISQPVLDTLGSENWTLGQELVMVMRDP